MEKFERRLLILFLTVIGLILFVPIVFGTAWYRFVNDTSLVIGVTGFAQKVAFRGVFCVIAGIIAIRCLVRLFRRDRPPRQRLAYAVGILLCLVAVYFLVRPLILDLPYLDRPEVVCLSQVDFDDSWGTGDAPHRYYLRGVDEEGNRHSFEISRERFEEGRALKLESGIHAKASYLPHTSVLMELTYLTERDPQP